ncbi:MAG: hypothetical protein HDR88_15310 [Bacteroides sp.]|nr:hypothetical protein [Bacteroides sp.]
MRKLILTLTIVLPGLSVPANVLTPDQALQRLSQAGISKLPSASSYKLVNTTEGDTGATAYVFNSENNGFIILSADDCACPVLGYADNGIFDSQNIPCGMTTWLDFYSRQIDEARAVGLITPWRKSSSQITDRESLSPALTTQWSQGEPYNNLCPMHNDKRCVTGCVATAMAQVLNLYRYSTHGNGSHSYIWTHIEDGQILSEELTLDFSEVEFDWDNMLDSYSENYTEEEANAVAQLMYACGVAVNMKYNHNASSAVANFVSYSLWQYFDYNSGAQCVQRDSWKEKGITWDDFVYEQLQQHGAVLYNGITSAEEGHAFVCDGYSEDGYFHFNWGWNGVSDGYFRLDALNPEVQGTGGSSASLAFNYNQNIIAFLDPNDNGGEFLPPISGRDENFNITNKSVELGGKFTVAGWIVNESQLDYDLEFGCLLTDSEYGTEGEVISVMDFTLPSCEAKTIYKKAQFPTEIADGFYCIRPVITWEGLGRWWTLPWNVKKDHVWVEVKDGTAYFNVDPGNSGIQGIHEIKSHLPYYLNLQGVKVEDPQPGETYIKITGTKATKIIF